MQSGMPYPWMQRPMPGQWMPGMENTSMGNMGQMPPEMMTPGMSSPGAMNPDMGNIGMINSNMNMWNMGRWTPDMWNPDREDMDERRDMEYWQQLYPAQTRRVQREVEHQCDLLDYEGSVMYDEYPDRVSLSRICEAVYQALMQSGALENQGMMSGDMTGSMTGNMTQNSSSEFEEDMDMSELTAEEEAAGARNYQPIGQVDMMQYGRRDRNDRSLPDLIEVLLFHEMHRRRRRRRRRRNWYFG